MDIDKLTTLLAIQNDITSTILMVLCEVADYYGQPIEQQTAAKATELERFLAVSRCKLDDLYAKYLYFYGLNKSELKAYKLKAMEQVMATIKPSIFLDSKQEMKELQSIFNLRR